MPTNIVIPALGESITEGVISAWLKGEGDYVERDEPVLELETDKITVEVPAPASGVIHTKAKPGDTVKVGAQVGMVDESAKKPAGGAAAKPAKSEARGAATSAPGSPARQPSAPSPSGGGPGRGDSAASASAAPAQEVHATPLAKKIADEHHVDLSRIQGSGPGGRVREQDVLAYIQTNGASSPAPAATGAVASAAGASRGASAPAPSGRAPGKGDAMPGTGSRAAHREKMSPLRQRVAARLVEAQHTAAMLTTFNECDMTRVMALRSRHKDDFEKSHGVKLGFMSFFVKASVSALRAFPRVNAFIVQGAGGPEVETHDYCDIAVAVGTDRGLVVPVIRNCESLTFAGVERAILDFAARAKDGKLSLEEMQGGTFTISNGGVYGSMMSTPILNPPQSAILGMHNILRRAVENPEKPGSGEVVVRPMMYLALSYDHRMVDGAEAVGFLRHIKGCIEDPERLLLGV